MRILVGGDITSLAAQVTPYLSAAVGAYGGAVLAKVRDDAADATVGLGRRLLQRIFGPRSPGDPLPDPLQDLAADPHDADALAALRLSVRKVLDADPALAGEVRSMLAAAGVVVQRVDAGGDVIVAGRDLAKTGDVSVYVGSVQGQEQPTITSRYQLLADAQYFTGRQAELDRLRRAIAAPDGVPSGAVAIHAIDGGAGVGKTTLVVHLAHELAAH